ncbi:AraC family transcriptional regulator [Flavobacterium sp.]|uniref:helix-turn-helix domain-containing protein n=1 Tax=Flavobacterium sp. TaxID=239 RepID=UPI002634D711|nr:helix-turn-helix domain-containing protein [Flavobacterium sp.]
MTKFIFSVIVLLSCTLNYAQELNDLEIKKTRSLQEHLISNPELAYKEALEISASENLLFSFHGNYYIANYFYNKAELLRAKQLLIKLLDTIEKSALPKDSKGYQDLVAMCVNKLFYVHKNLGAYDSALWYLDHYKKKIPNNHFNEQYASIKVAMGDYANGIALLKKGLTTTHHLKLGVGEKKTMNNKLFADKYNNIGEAYQAYYLQSKKRVLLDSANYYFKAAATLLLKDNFYPDYTKALLCMREAKSAALAGNYVKSLALYRERKKYPVVKDNIRTEQLFDLGMADCFHHLKQVDSALYYSKKYVSNYQITKVSKENLLMAYNIMTQAYNTKKDTKNAYLYAQKSLALIQTIEGIKSNSLNFLHNYDLNIIKEESNEILASKNYFKISLVGISLVLVLVMLGFYYYHKLQKEKHQRFLEIIQNLKETKTPDENSPINETTEPLPKQTMDEELIEKIGAGLTKLELKEAFLDPNFKLAYVAKKLTTNTAYLSQYFNQVRQKTFSEYTQELRIQYVLQKLNDAPYFRNYTLQAIAEEVGYKDANTFVRVFKKQTGLSPNYYIEKLAIKA